jgi:hypothetical protein
MKPIGSLSLDLDNEWAYIKTHGDPAWESFPSYLDLVVPRFLDVLDRLQQRITVMIVGQDAALPKNRTALRLIPAAGHEIGNHSFHHEPWMQSYTAEQVEDEIVSATEAIAEATGVRPVGFRGPGFCISRAILGTLAKHGYHYDCSTFPTFIGPLARAYYFMTARLTRAELSRRKALFGNLRDGLRPLKPYAWDLGDESLVEVPVTTFPIIKLPIHFSYVLFIGEKSPALALVYFQSALLACRALGITPSLLLHPLDFTNAEEIPSVAFFPAMRSPLQQKLKLLERALVAYRDLFDVRPLGEHVGNLQAGVTDGAHGRPLAVRPFA